MKDYIRISDRDNVIVALRELAAGEEIVLWDGRTTSGLQVTVRERILAGHKMALTAIPAGGRVIKYGFPIGIAKEAIPAGAWVHVHNVRTALDGKAEYVYEPAAAAGGLSGKTDCICRQDAREAVPDTREEPAPEQRGESAREAVPDTREEPIQSGMSAREASPDTREEPAQSGTFVREASPDTRETLSDAGEESSQEGAFIREASSGTEEPPVQDAFFQGFVRTDGSVGVRNEIWIIPTVGCVNGIAEALARGARGRMQGSVDDVVAFPHPYGCSQMGDDQEHTRTILADLVRHPNAGGVLVLGLGCENSNIGELKKYIGEYDECRVKFLVCQECEDELAEGAALLDGLIRYAAGFVRERVPAGKLVVGLKCGGSDGFSGITANPLVGRFSDLLIAQGGTTILTEVPEMFGAETILMNRCENRELFQKTVSLINDFKQYYIDNHQTIYENPSPGNKQGGITTLEDKSLGCTQKSGTAPVRGVLAYGERVSESGLQLLSAPGNDLVAATALAAAGAQIILFTTGRGTPFASPVPTVKIASNGALAGKKRNWIDFNAGILLEDTTFDDTGAQLFSYVMEVASGRKVCSEEAGYHDLAIFKQGVTL